MTCRHCKEATKIKVPLTGRNGTVTTQLVSIEEAERRLMNARNTIWAMQERVDVLKAQVARAVELLEKFTQYTYSGNDLSYYCEFCEASEAATGTPSNITHDSNCPTQAAQAFLKEYNRE